MLTFRGLGSRMDAPTKVRLLPAPSIIPKFRSHDDPRTGAERLIEPRSNLTPRYREHKGKGLSFSFFLRRSPWTVATSSCRITRQCLIA